MTRSERLWYDGKCDTKYGVADILNDVKDLHEWHYFESDIIRINNKECDCDIYTHEVLDAWGVIVVRKVEHDDEDNQ